MMLANADANVLDKSLLDTLLKEMANRYRKIDKKGYQSVEKISYDQIENAISFLYGNNTEIDQDIITFVKAFCEMSENELWNEYDKMLNTTQLVNEEVTQDEFREVIKGKQDAKELSAKIFLKHKGN